MKNTRTIPKIDGSGSATLIVTDGKVDPRDSHANLAEAADSQNS